MTGSKWLFRPTQTLSKTMMSAFLLVALLMSGCTTAQEPAQAPITPGESSYADYLVGQFAVRHREMQTGADHLLAIQALDDLPTQFASNLNRQLFTILAGEGRIGEAAMAAQGLDENDLLAQLVLIVEDINQGDTEAAAKRAAKLGSNGLGTYVKPLVHSWTLAASGDRAKTLQALASLKEQEGLEALYHLHSALINEFFGDLKAAEDHYKQASDGPGGISLRLAELYGTLLFKQERFEEARRVYADYILNHPDSLYIQSMLDEMESGALATRAPLSIKDGIAETLFGLASSLRSRSTRQAGLIMGQLALHIKADFPLAQILVAEILESDTRFADANKMYGAIAQENPFSWPARLRMALNMDDLGQTDEAVATLEGMIKQHPDRLEPHVTLGDVLRHRERFDGAQKAYGTAIDMIGDDLAPHHWSLLYSRAITLERLKRWEEAEPLFLKALELEPDQPHVLNYLGYSWIEIGRNMEQAREMIEKAVSQRPRDGYIVDSLGWVLYRLGEYEEAVVHLERAVELQPSDPVINDHLGDAYWKVGRTREARFQWKRAKSLEPENDLLSTIRAKLESGLKIDEET